MMETIGKEELVTILRNLYVVFQKNEQELIRLDSEMGDGDLGLTMSKAFSKVDSEIGGIEKEDLGKILFMVGRLISQAAPSTMGTLLASGFMKAGKELKEKKSFNLTEMTVFLEKFVSGIMQRGKAEPGDKTIIDSLHPAVETLKKCKNKTLKQAFAAAYKSAQLGVESTKNMIAKHGRIAYYQEQSKGKEDPGAIVGKLLIQGIYEAM